MQTVAMGPLRLGEGRPVICAPLTAGEEAALLKQAAAVAASLAGLAEWRADHFKGDIPGMLTPLCRALGDTPLLFTYRSAAEGGEGRLADAEAEALLAGAIASGCCAGIDLEERLPALAALAGQAQAAGVCPVVSRHFFTHTPPREELEALFGRLAIFGLPKIAAMPQAFEDVLALMGAAAAYTQRAGRPVVAISMGPLGAVTRLAGQCFGSALSFGSVVGTSAPGQLEAGALAGALALMDTALQG